MSSRSILPAFLLSVVLAFTAASLAKAEPTPGWKAYTSGNHDQAEAIWRPLAEEGDYHAAFGMAVLAQSRNQHEDAAAWYEQAARAGLTSAQVLLGSMYIDGRGVPRDAVRAYAWLHRATLDGHANAARARDAVGAALTPDQVSQAEALSLTLKAPE
ncbi:MAG: tetratricopeptide repeat protein [Proteobacteria bacterium]|nr:tetratricopeptide repeat protein [Pseudomonadota bacterium]MDA1355201.1 tetratricopeptide repeat protein [Pseudomonadota bacterium]